MCSIWRLPVVLATLVRVAASADSDGVLDLSRVDYSNLGGLGPMRDVEQTLRFREVLDIYGVKVDMALTAGQGYTPHDVSLNGLVDQLNQGNPVAAISLKAGTAIDLKVEFFEMGTTTPIRVPKVVFSVFDLERPSAKEEKRVTVKGFDAVYLTRATELMFQRVPGGAAFRPSDGAPVGDVTDPGDGLLLSEQQRAHAATFIIHSVQAFSLRFALHVEDAGAGAGAFADGGLMLFGSAGNAQRYAARIPISYIRAFRMGWLRPGDWLDGLANGEDDADSQSATVPEGIAFREPSSLESTCTCNLDLTNVMVNNLGGLGPDHGYGQMLRFGEVCTVYGRKVDLVIEDEGDYRSTSPVGNGASTCGPYASISVKLGTMVVLKARFLDSLTNEATRVGHFFFSVFDMDLHGDHAEKVTIHGFTESFLSGDTMVRKEQVMTGGVFSSTGVLAGVQCPADPLALTDQQASVGVTALFHDVGEFSFALEVMGDESESSHNFLIGGTSSINADCRGSGLPTTTATATSTTVTTGPSTVTETTTTTFDCSAHLPSLWSEEKTTYCCNLDTQFCPTTTVSTATTTSTVTATSTTATATATTNTATTTTTTETTTEPFDCSDDDDSDDDDDHGRLEEWSSEHRAYCCEQHNIGCTTSTSTRPDPFDCSEYEPDEWSSEKQAWCCDHREKGCSLSGGRVKATTLASTTRAPYSGCGEAVACELRLDKVIHDNLGGKGPDKIEPAVIRYGDVCLVDGQAIDLIISVDGQYDPFNALDNGKSAWGPYGSVNVKLGTTANLRASFVKAGTETPTKISSVIFSLFGLHQDSPQHQETVTIYGFDSFHLAAGTYLAEQHIANGAIFESTDQSSQLDASGDPLHCSENQERTAVSFFFREASSFTLSLTVAGQPTEGGRDFLFGGRSCITEHCAAAGGAGARKAGRTAASGELAPVTAPEADRYDCLHGDKAMWPVAQRDWCCRAKSIGCAKPYDCQAGFANWRLAWPEVKKDWCCQHEQRGCPFHCDVALNNWKAAWSKAKKRWCCQREQKGCRSPPTPEQYDCGTDPMTWAPDQQKWCCRVKHKGCDRGDPNWKPFDCDEGYRVWQSTWTHPKKQWCCRNFGRGCEGTTPEPFDCTEGFAAWRTSWAPPKQEWCCHNYNRGCSNIVRRYEQVPPVVEHLRRAFPAALVAGGVVAISLGLAASAAGRHLRLEAWLLPQRAYTRLVGSQAGEAASELEIRRIRRLEADEAPP